jgi:hypothetical protein
MIAVSLEFAGKQKLKQRGRFMGVSSLASHWVRGLDIWATPPRRSNMVLAANRLPTLPILGGQRRLPWWGIGAGVHVEPHSHPNEQTAWMIKGEIEFRIDSGLTPPLGLLTAAGPHDGGHDKARGLAGPLRLLLPITRCRAAVSATGVTARGLPCARGSRLWYRGRA